MKTGQNQTEEQLEELTAKICRELCDLFKKHDVHPILTVSIIGTFLKVVSVVSEMQ